MDLLAEHSGYTTIRRNYIESYAKAYSAESIPFGLSDLVNFLSLSLIRLHNRFRFHPMHIAHRLPVQCQVNHFNLMLERTYYCIHLPKKSNRSRAPNLNCYAAAGGRWHSRSAAWWENGCSSHVTPTGNEAWLTLRSSKTRMSHHQKDSHNNGCFRFPFGHITNGYQYILGEAIPSNGLVS